MFNNKQLLEVMNILSGYSTPEVKEIKHTVVRLLSGASGVTREIEEESLKVQLHNLLDL